MEGEDGKCTEYNGEVYRLLNKRLEYYYYRSKEWLSTTLDVNVVLCAKFVLLDKTPAQIEEEG